METIADRRAARLPLGFEDVNDLEAAFAAAPDGLLLIGENGRIRYVNPAAERLLGQMARALIGRPADTLRCYAPGTDAPGGGALLADPNDGAGRPLDGPAAPTRVFRRPDNVEQPLSVSSGTWRTSHGDCRIVILRDAGTVIAEERRLQGEKARAEAASRAKTTFLARLSHELRTPLNAIIGFAEIIQKAMVGPVGNPKYQEYGADIRESADHLLQLINGLLDMSVIEQGHVRLREEIFGPAEVAEEAVRLVAPTAGRAGIALATLLPPLPRLLADRTKIRQVLVNFLANAVKFTPAGGRVDLRAWLDSDGGLEFAVSDTGIGMTAEDLARVSRPYIQGAGGIALPGEGVGLGLSLAKQLAELHGGLMRLESTYGEGTTAILKLPAERIITEGRRAEPSTAQL